MLITYIYCTVPFFIIIFLNNKHIYCIPSFFFISFKKIILYICILCTTLSLSLKKCIFIYVYIYIYLDQQL
ncbi:hypothetical protein BJ944DRAFT_260431 [Cunninghamella echinulata]|nr:hypothetical protein BJ944DRAFT_260431 [Cunninghamella echinulata]